jgi:hypothetical protein
MKTREIKFRVWDTKDKKFVGADLKKDRLLVSRKLKSQCLLMIKKGLGIYGDES